jgi:DNA polymerase III alpha subunit
MTIPQLRVRTEYSFRQTFAPLPRLAEVLDEIECPAAAIVDPGTWGHGEWAKIARKHAFTPLFGTELIVPQENGFKPVAWVLAAETKAFYRFSSAARKADTDMLELFREAGAGVIRFAGAALRDPECFDYIDVNPASPLSRRRAIELHAACGKPIVITSDNWYPAKSDFSAFSALNGRERVTPQHLCSEDELRKALGSGFDFDLAMFHTYDVAARCASVLPSAPIIQFEGDLSALAQSGKEERLALGHIAAWTPEYEARLIRELAMIAKKQYESYFVIVADLIKWAKQRMLVGPARGSSAGSLVCYLLRITEIDPMPHELLFERFIDITRSDLPDIDIDFSDAKRPQVFEYLAEKYGRENVARIGSISTLGPRSVIAKVVDRMAIPEREKYDVVNVMVEYSSGDARYGHSLEDTMTQTAPGRRFIEAHPEAAVMFEIENHASHTGVHAAGVIVCNEPLSDYCTVGEDYVIQGDKGYSEQVGLLKIDALGLRTLGIIEDAGVVTADELYALKLDDPEVLKVLNDRKYSGVFQFEGTAMRSVATEVDIKSFQEIDHITALARPGPLGGGASNHYIQRAAGREAVTYRHPSMERYLSSTRGVVLYQEQVMMICAEIGQFSWETVSEIRKAMSASKGKEYFDRRGAEFIAGALSIGVPEDDAAIIWAEICTFGAWGMNKSHTVSYAVISYWCAWMKRYHPLEFAAANLRNAKDEDQATDILREIVAEGTQYVAFDVDLSGIKWAAVGGKLVGGFTNLPGIGPAKAYAAVTARDSGKMTPAAREKFVAMAPKFSQLYPIQAAYAPIYADPASIGCREGSEVLLAVDFPTAGGDVLYIGRVVEKKRRDTNEVRLIAKRDGKRHTGDTLFADIVTKDDSGIPIICRIDRYNYEPNGRLALDNLVVGDDLLIRGRRIPGFPMIKVEKIKCLNKPEVFDEKA